MDLCMMGLTKTQVAFQNTRGENLLVTHNSILGVMIGAIGLRCLFDSAGPAPGSKNLLSLSTSRSRPGREGGRRDLKHAQLIAQFTVYKHAMSELSTNSDQVISGCRSDRSRTAIIQTRKGSFYFSPNKPVIRFHVTTVTVYMYEIHVCIMSILQKFAMLRKTLPLLPAAIYFCIILGGKGRR